MGAEASRTRRARDGARRDQDAPLLSRAINALGRIPVIGPLIVSALIFAPGLAAAIAYEITLSHARALSLNAPPETIPSGFFTWFPDAPRLAIAAGAGALFLFGATTILWTRILRAAGASPRFLFLPGIWWGRIIVLGAIVVLIAGFIAPAPIAEYITREEG